MAQELEKLKADPGEGGVAAGLAPTSHHQGDPGDQQQQLLLLFRPPNLT